MKKRTVTQIKNYLSPGEIFHLITSLNPSYQGQYPLISRDRAMMASCFCSAGRISEVVGGPIFKWNREKKRAFPTGKKHPGLQVENLKVSDRYILITGMVVVKRSHKLIKKYGPQIAVRDDFAIPLQRGLFNTQYWDQLVPFGWLIEEYLRNYAPKRGKLFPYEDTRAFQIIKEVTGKFPNWFRAQAEHFYGHYLLPDTVKLAKFVKIQDPKHVKHYIGYSWTEQLKDVEASMDFNWIDKAIKQIQSRMKLK